MENEDLLGYGAVGSGLGLYAGENAAANAAKDWAEKSIPWKHWNRNGWVDRFVEVAEPRTDPVGRSLGLKEQREALGPFLGKGKQPWFKSPWELSKNVSKGMRGGGALLAALGIYELMT